MVAPSDSSKGDPYRGVVLVLLAMAALGTVIAAVGNAVIGNPVLSDVALTLILSVGVLIGIARAQAIRTRPPKSQSLAPVLAEPPREEEPPSPPATPEPQAVRHGSGIRSYLDLSRIDKRIRNWYRDLGELGMIRIGTAGVGILGILWGLSATFSTTPPDSWVAGIGAAVCLVAAGLTATTVRYLIELDPNRLPEAPGLARGTRVVGWIFVLAAAALGLAWAGQQTMVQIVHLVLLTIIAAVCYELIFVKQPQGKAVHIFPLDFDVLSMLGSRTNVLAGILDAGERQLGIDLRSTWALTVVRRSVEPLVIALFVVAWLSTSLTVVGIEEQGLVERLGVPVGGPALEPGVHLHLPWPIDHVFRIPARRVQAVQVGHEGEEEGGPENVLWAVEHAPNEYTLVLGNGRDLITVDAAVQFRIADARAWRYHSQNPGEAMRAIAYRAVMRNTVNRTLADALSENVVTTTARMRAMVQADADALGLGVEVLGFTVGGMHPPVPVAADYQAVVSAELRKVTEVVNAQAFRNQIVPAAEAFSLTGQNTARAQGADALGRAAGEAWAFRTLQSQYLAAPQEYFFRRRLETLEKNLMGRRFTVVDARIQRDGGELWLNP